MSVKPAETERSRALPPAARTVGDALHDFAARLYPICRSITGEGVRKTLGIIHGRIPLQIHEVPTGTRVFDWEVPLEWNIEDAWIRDPDGRKVADFQSHNLHVVGYSEPVHKTMPLADLMPKLHSSPKNADWIPYRTSYYRRQWGFCLSDRELQSLPSGRYEVHVASSLAKGSLTYGELVVPGRTAAEVLLFTHVCHPSLANDNTSGMAIATELGTWLASVRRRYTYRMVFAPGTIGSLCWLKKNERRLARIHCGFVLGLLGDPGPLTYKHSRRGDTEIDRIAPYVVKAREPAARLIPFGPYGYDERQLCSPGFDLPIGRLTRSVNDGYPEYHTSADDLALLSPRALEGSLDACKEIVATIEANQHYVNQSPKGEPQLGKRGLYGAVGGRSPAEREHAMLWVLNQSDGRVSLLDIAERSGIGFAAINRAAEDLAAAGLLAPRAAERRVLKAKKNKPRAPKRRRGGK